MKGPRVVHIVPALFGASGIVGGGERYALEIARHMAERVPTTLVTFGAEAREEQMGRLQVKVLRRTWSVRGQVTNPMAPALVREVLRADVVHCHQQHILSSSIAALVARSGRRGIFVSDLGGGGWDISSYVSTDRLYQGHLHISAYSRRVGGQDAKDWAHVIYGGVDTAKFTPAPAADGVRPGERRPPVLFVGRLMPHKGVNYLVEAVTSDTPLVVLGRPYDAQFTRELERLAEGKDVTFRHGCDDVELVEAYQNALCVVLPSVYRTLYGVESTVPELLGQTLLEGMACGIPAICTDVASMPEVVEDGVSGFVVPPNDPSALRSRIRWLVDHPVEASAMGKAARARVLSTFRWEPVVEHCLAIYERSAPWGWTARFAR